MGAARTVHSPSIDMRSPHPWKLCAALAVFAGSASADPDAYEPPEAPAATTARKPWLQAPAVPEGPAVPPAQTPKAFEWNEGDRVAAGYHLESRPAMGLLITGSALFGVPYVGGIFSAASDRFDNQKGWLALPVVGPWMTGFKRKEQRCDGPSYDDCQPDFETPILLITDGVLQATGAILIAAGLASTTTWQVPNGQVRVAPAVTGSTAGLVAHGTF